MTPQEVLDAIVRGLKDATAFTGGDYSTQQLDPAGAGSRFSQPVVTLQPVSTIRNDGWNTDLVGYTTDGQGNQTGRIFEAVFEMDVQIDLWVASGNAQLDATALGGDLQRALFQYDSSVVGQLLPDGDGGTVVDIEQVTVGDGSREDDLSGPGVRRWRQSLSVRFHERLTTDAEYVKVVETPASGTATGGSGSDGVAIELTVSD